MSASLSTVDLSSEALAFIKAGTPKPQVERPALAQAPAKNVEHESAPLGSANEEIVQRDTKPTRQKPPAALDDDVVPALGVVGLSFRLPAEIHHALMKASLEQKMKRKKPWHQQEIAAEALSSWLKKQGYL